MSATAVFHSTLRQPNDPFVQPDQRKICNETRFPMTSDQKKVLKTASWSLLFFYFLFALLDRKSLPLWCSLVQTLFINCICANILPPPKNGWNESIIESIWNLCRFYYYYCYYSFVQTTACPSDSSAMEISSPQCPAPTSCIISSILLLWANHPIHTETCTANTGWPLSVLSPMCVIWALSPCLNVQHHFFPRGTQQRIRVWFYSWSLCNHLLNFGVAHHLSGRCFLIASNWPSSSLWHFSPLCYLSFS